MNLWLLSQEQSTGYDTFDSVVVAAQTEAAARRIHPSHYYEWDDTNTCWAFLYIDGRRELERHDNTWANDIDSIAVKFLGRATAGIKAGVICASFNAG